MKQYWVIFVFPLCICACSVLSEKETPHVQEKIMAKYYLMRANLNMLKRENEVLNEELLQYKQENTKQNEKLKSLKSELNSLQIKYEKDLAEKSTQIEAAKMEHDEFEKRADGIILELTKTNKGLEENFARESTRLNQIIDEMKTSFAAEKKALNDTIADKKKTCSQKIASFEKQLSAKNALIETVEKQLAESKLQTGICQQKADEYLARAYKVQKFLDEQMEKIKSMDQNFQELKKNSEKSSAGQ